jgi:hypothetical protein
LRCPVTTGRRQRGLDAGIVKIVGGAGLELTGKVV